MDENNSNIAMAMLFGDKSNLDESTRSNFAHIGISHILAVSGLHISIIISALYFIMKIFKLGV